MMTTEHGRMIGAALREAAHYRGVGTDELAARFGVSVETVRRVMRGDHPLTIDAAFAYLDALGAPREWVVTPPPDGPAALRMLVDYDRARGLP